MTVGSPVAAFAMVFKLAGSAQARWRAITGDDRSRRSAIVPERGTRNRRTVRCGRAQ
ncbi:hypothetical protein EES39_29630 [Streptomyces sp. ADI92-24]|nr:hypothetical protein EES39_29630 [Streptomyces sp. ADI92-24]